MISETASFWITGILQGLMLCGVIYGTLRFIIPLINKFW